MMMMIVTRGEEVGRGASVGSSGDPWYDGAHCDDDQVADNDAHRDGDHVADEEVNEEEDEDNGDSEHKSGF